MSDRDPIDPESLLLERVELAFPELLPGFRVHERKLQFDGRPVADLLAWGGGRAVLISLVGEDDDEATLCALDGLAVARDHGDVIASCIPGSNRDPLRPRVLLVADSFSSRLVERLEPLLGEDLGLLRRHEMRSSRGSLTRLEPFDGVAPPPASSSRTELPEWATVEPVRGFMARVAPDRLALTLEIADRIQRIDPSLEAVALDGDLAWQVGGRLLCRMCWVEGHVELFLSESSVPHAIRDESSIDFVLDWVMAGYLEILQAERAKARDAPEEAPDEVEAEPEPAGPEEAPAATPPEGVEGLTQIELRPMPPGPILTAEEIEAFHE